MGNVEEFRVPEKGKIRLDDYDPAWVPNWVIKTEDKDGKKATKDNALSIIAKNILKLGKVQEELWSSGTYSILIILQGMDAAGKDGIIKHVMSGVNPQGCEVVGFRTPSEEDLKHDFLWRYSKSLPEKGCIGIFNRSYYEEVLITKIRPEVIAKENLPTDTEKDAFWQRRYEDINLFEQHLARNYTLILKFFLHISKDKQKTRLLKRLKDPDKQWKFSLSDLSERSKWKEYMEAYEDLLTETSTQWAPWYIIPSDKKWVSHALISGIIVTEIQKLNLKYPVLSKEQLAALKQAKITLEKE